MPKYIPKSRFKPKTFEYFRMVEQTGEEIYITDHGKPVIRISPYSRDETRKIQELRNTVISYINPFKPVDEDEWEVHF